MADFLILLQVTPANPIHPPCSHSSLSYLGNEVLPMYNTFRTTSVKNPTKQRKCWVCLPHFVTHHILLTSCWKYPSKISTDACYGQRYIFTIILFSGSFWVKRGIKLGIHSIQTQDFLTHPIGNGHVPWNGICSRKPSHKGSITGPLWGHLFEREEERCRLRLDHKGSPDMA